MGVAPLSCRGAALGGILNTPPRRGPTPVRGWTQHLIYERTRGNSLPSSEGGSNSSGKNGILGGGGCGRAWAWVVVVVAWAAVLTPTCHANPDAKRLYDDLLSSYNRLIRPVGNNSDRLTVKLGLKLSQLIDVVSLCTMMPSFPHDSHPVSQLASQPHI